MSSSAGVVVPLVVLTLNIQGIPWYYGNLSSRRRARDIVTEILRLDRLPDILCLQEVFDDVIRRHIIDELRRWSHVALAKVPGVPGPTQGLVHATPQYPARNFVCALWRYVRFDDSGLLVMSRWPIVETRYRMFTRASGTDSLASKGVVLASVRIPSIFLNSSPSDLIIDVYATHMNAGGEGSVRAHQLAEIGAFMCETASGQLVMLAGDLNFTHKAQAWAELPGLLRPAGYTEFLHAEPPTDADGTGPSSHPPGSLSIDHVCLYTRAGTRVSASARVLPFAPHLSDHNAVEADVKFILAD